MTLEAPSEQTNATTNSNIDTGGGAKIDGEVNAGGDVIGRDQFRGEWIEVHHHYASPVIEPTHSLPPAPLPVVDCPYRGLEFFDVQHVANYFGRTEMTQKLLAKVQENNFVAVVGPSGSGKSSLVRAGMIPALCDGALTGSRDWRVEIVRPGENPLLALATPLVKLLDPTLPTVDRLAENEKLANRLRNGELSIGYVLDQLRGARPRLLLVVDQFEETFTLCTDETLRMIFLDTLLQAVEKPWLAVILTLRADFYGRLLEREALSKRVDAGLVNVLPMTHDERRAAIEQPALRSGRSFEGGLVERIVDDVAAEPGQLPLLEFALTELWARQSEQGVMSHAAYEAIGQVSGAIAKRADETLRSLKPEQQEQVRTIFTRLVRVTPPDEGAEDTKRRLLLDEIDPTLRPLVQSLADARLLVTGRDEQQKSETVEVAHEALIRKWGALQTWLNSDRAFLLWRQRLHTIQENWQQSKEDEGSLLRGAVLGEAEGYLAARASELSSGERSFIEKSRELAIRAVKAKEATALLLRRRNQFLTAALTVALLAFLGALYFWSDARNKQQHAENAAEAEAHQRATAEVARAEAVAQKATAEAETVRADQSAAAAETAKRRAQAGEMAAQVQANIVQMNGVDDATILLAREAMLTTLKVDLYVTVNADRALRNVVDKATWYMEVDYYQYHDGIVREANFSPDGRWIVSCDDANMLRIWDATTLRPVKALGGHTDFVTSASFSPDSKWIVSASGDGTMKLWDVASGENVRIFSGHKNVVYSARFSPDGKYIVSAGWDNTVRLWDVASGKEVHTLSGHESVVYSANFSPDSKWVVSASGDNTLKLWDVASGGEVRTLVGHGAPINSASFSPNGKWIVSAGLDDTMRLWEAESGKEVHALSGHSQGVNSASFSPNSKWIVSAGGDGMLKLWDVANGGEVRTLVGHRNVVYSANFSSDGKWIISVSGDGTFKLWETASGEDLRILSNHEFNVTSASFSPDGKWIVTASGDDTLKLWEVASGEEVRTLRGHTNDVTSASFSPDGKWIVSASWDDTLKLWEVASGEEVRTLRGHTDRVTSASFSPDGKWIVSASEDSSVRLWEVVSGKEVRTLTDHTSGVNSAAFSPDGKWIISTSGDFFSNDWTLKLWDAMSGKQMRTLVGHTGDVNSAVFSPDGKWIASASDDGTVRLWVASIDDLLQMAEARIQRPVHELTADERRQFGLE